MKIHLVVLEVLHADKHNENAFLGRPNTRAVPIKLAPSVRPPTHSPTVATKNMTATATTLSASDISILISIYFCSSDPEGGYGPQDTEHVNSI